MFKCKEILLNECPLLKNWLEEIPDIEIQNGRLITFNRGEVIFREDDSFNRIYFIAKGTVMISKISVSGEGMGVFYVTEGQLLGEIEAILETGKLGYDGVALKDCILFEVPLSDFKKWLSSNLSLSRQLNQMLAKKLQDSARTTVMYHQLPTATRIKLFFIKCGLGVVKASREDIATFCGVSARTIYRLLPTMQSNDELTIEKGKITISTVNLNNLEKNLNLND